MEQTGEQREEESGVCYLSRVPPGMTVADARHYFSAHGVGRIYFNPLPGRQKPRRYKDGYLEFVGAGRAEAAARQFNGRSVGGKKSGRFHDDLWSLRFVAGLRWAQLAERRAEEKRVAETRIKAEIRQVSRVHNFIVGQQLKHRKWKKLEQLGQEPAGFRKNIFKPKKPVDRSGSDPVNS